MQEDYTLEIVWGVHDVFSTTIYLQLDRLPIGVPRGSARLSRIVRVSNSSTLEIIVFHLAFWFKVSSLIRPFSSFEG